MQFPAWRTRKRFHKCFLLRFHNHPGHRSFILRMTYTYYEDSLFHLGQRVSFTAFVLKQIVFIAYTSIV
jgi:hypothetical protein